MPFVVAPSKDNFTTDISAIFEDFKYSMGLPEVPNLLKVMGHSENVVKGTWSLIENILVHGSTPRSVKEMLIMSISLSRGGPYSQKANSIINRMIGIDVHHYHSLSSNPNEMHSHILRDILIFGTKCAKDPQSLTCEDFKSLEKYNLTPSEIVEIISVVGLAVYLNIFVDATGTISDEMFS
jgi:hypothetical protein